MLDPAKLVFIDETAVSTNMVRLRGRAPRAGIREAIEKARAILRYLPKYSPDLIRSSCPTANSKLCCGKLPREPCPDSIEQLARSCPSSVLRNAATTFQACRLCFNMIGNRFKLADALATAQGQPIMRTAAQPCRATIIVLQEA